MREYPKEFIEKVISWRHYLHTIPETAFEEKETSAFVAEKLKSFGIETATGIGGTGVVGTLKAGDSDRVIGLRADMDALNIPDKGCHDHVSTHPGKIHGCGHDGHTITLLAAAEVLSQKRDFNGTVRFIFQPAEEPGRGAPAMIADGLFEKYPVDEIYGMHNMPSIPAGHFHTRVGGFMASEDNFTIKITGRGGHASSPHLVIDPLAPACEIYLALQTIVSRNASPVRPVVVSCTEWETDGAHNAIPTHVTIKGDTRSTTPGDSALIENRMREICDHICEMNGASCEFTYTHEFFPLVNDEECVKKAVRAATDELGADAVDGNAEPWMGSEDFAAFLKKVPGCFFVIGTGKGYTPLHNACFDYNDEIISTGIRVWDALVHECLK